MGRRRRLSEESDGKRKRNKNGIPSIWVKILVILLVLLVLGFVAFAIYMTLKPATRKTDDTLLDDTDSPPTDEKVKTTRRTSDGKKPTTPRVDEKVTTPKAKPTTPKVETTISKAKPTTPKVETTTPKANTTTPKVETTTPKANTTTPKVETTTSKAESTTTKNLWVGETFTNVTVDVQGNNCLFFATGPPYKNKKILRVSPRQRSKFNHGTIRKGFNSKNESISNIGYAEAEMTEPVLINGNFIAEEDDGSKCMTGIRIKADKLTIIK